MGTVKNCCDPRERLSSFEPGSGRNKRRNNMAYTKQSLKQDLAAMGLTGAETDP